MFATFLRPGSGSRLGPAVLGLLCLAAWALSHSYLGMFHDAGLYTLQALSRLTPESLTEDVFLRFGSQDRFTIFSPLYAGVSRLLGIEPAAALLTLTFQLALLACGWALARAVMPASMALLGVAVLIAIPGDYGADRIFTCIEPFLTPRMAAEALTLGSLAAAMSSRRVLAAPLIVMAALIHPVMAAAGIAALLCLYVATPRQRLAMALAATGLLAITAQAFVVPTGPWGRFDDTWLELVRNRSPYLFLAHWQLDDWSRAAVSLATLAAGRSVLPNPKARGLSWITLLTVLSGLALTWLACDLLHLVLFTQLQPWRWQWLGTVVAALLLPDILRTLWGEEVAGRAAALLLSAAWIFASNAYALAAAAAALASLAFLHRLKASEARWVFWGACGMLAIALAWRVASNLQFTDAHYLDPNIPLWIRRAMSFSRDGTAPVAVITLAWWLARSRRGHPASIVLGVLAAVGCTALFSQTWHSWTAREFPSKQVAQFAAFRERIPPGSEVFWPESPLAVWMLLDRASYLSVLQTSGMVFSRQSALELSRRAHALRFALPPSSFMNWNTGGTGLNLSRQQLKQACDTSEFEFLVTAADLGVEPVAVVPTLSGPSSKKIRLYRCQPDRTDHREGPDEPCAAGAGCLTRPMRVLRAEPGARVGRLPWQG
jgi:hypothetical protein